MTEVLRILITAAIAAPVLLVASVIEMMANDEDAIFPKILGVDVFVIMVCTGIIAFRYLVELWS